MILFHQIIPKFQKLKVRLTSRRIWNDDLQNLFFFFFQTWLKFISTLSCNIQPKNSHKLNRRILIRRKVFRQFLAIKNTIKCRRLWKNVKVDNYVIFDEVLIQVFLNWFVQKIFVYMIWEKPDKTNKRHWDKILQRQRKQMCHLDLIKIF